MYADLLIRDYLRKITIIEKNLLMIHSKGTVAL